MRHTIANILGSGLLVVSLMSGTAMGADLGAGAALTQPAAAISPETALSRFYDLLAIRVTFDVLPAEELEPELAAAAARWRDGGVGAGEATAIENALLVEAGYYLTSIGYVAEVGGAAFPADRPYANYRGDTLVAVAALRDRLIAALAAGEPVHDILVEAQALRWLTEGQAEVPAGEDRLEAHDALIARLLAAKSYVPT